MSSDEKSAQLERQREACLEKLKETYDLIQMFFDLTDTKVISGIDGAQCNCKVRY